MIKKSNYLALLLFVFFGCSETEKTKTESIEFDPTVLDDKLVYEDGSINVNLSDSASKLYYKASRTVNSDSIRPYYLMKSADIQRFIPGKALIAIKKYYELQELYPDHILVPAAYFMIGLTFDENLKDKERSAKVYNDFLKKYPQHILAEQAQNLLIIANDSLSDLEQVHQWNRNIKNNQ